MKYQIEAERRIRVGLVGAGSHAYRNILPTLSYLPVELCAIADTDLDRARKVAAQFGARAAYGSATEMYEKERLDAVFLVVSPQLHPRLTIEAFKAGLHVYMEKPSATRTAEVGQMIAARGGRVWAVGYKKAFMPATRKALSLLALPENGPLRSLLGVYPISLPENGRETLEKGQMNPWLANGCHPLSFLLEVGGPVSEVIVHRGRHDGGAAILRHSNGAVSTLYMAAGMPNSQACERYLVASGSISIEIENSRKLTYQKGIDFNYAYGTDYLDGAGAQVWEAENHLNSPENMSVMTQGLFAGLEHFVNCVLDGTRPTMGTLEFSYHLTEVWEAVLVSNGAAVEITSG